MPDFFISRNRADANWAVWIAWQLETAGYSTLSQDWDFLPGSNFALEMQRATSDAKRTIAVLSPDFLRSEYTAPEWAAAFAKDPAGAKRQLVPVRVRPCRPTGLLAQIVYIDLVDLDEPAARDALLKGVKQGRAKPAEAPLFPGNAQGQAPAFPGRKRQRPMPVREQSRGNTPARSVSEARTLSTGEIATRLESHQWGVRPNRGHSGWTGDVWLGAVLVPERQDAPYIDVLELGRGELRDQILGLALVGPSAVFRLNRGTEATEREDHLLLEQYDGQTRRLMAALEVHTDGTLVFRTAVDRRAPKMTGWLADSHVIDEDAVRRAVTAFVAFADGFYNQRRRTTGDLSLGLSLSDVAFKHFGRLPNYEMNSFTIGDPRVPDPLRVPSTPLKVTRRQLAKPESVADTAVQYIARAFRLGGAYFTP